MLRKKIFNAVKEEGFYHRGKEIFRIEALSDAVFAFSVSLLVASLEVPQTFDELMIITKGAIPFFLTVSLVFLFWYQQYVFFRRYGLNDIKTILLNLAYLAVVIFYIYPLKFLFSLLISSWLKIDLFSKATEKGLVVLSNEDFPRLIILFSIGYILIWFIIFLMHRHVISLSKSFNFNSYEKLCTQKEISGALWNTIIGIIGLTLAFFRFERMAGMSYLLIPIALIINEWAFSKRMKKARNIT